MANYDGRPLLKDPSEATLKARAWRNKRKALATAIGVNAKDLGRTVPLNKDNYWSDDHRKMLYHMAKVCRDFLYARGVNTRNIELDDLVNAGWLMSARKHKTVNGCGRDYLVAMLKYVRNQTNSLNGSSRIRVCYFEELLSPKVVFKNVINHTRDVDEEDALKFIFSKVPKKSTREMLEMLFIDGIHKAEIARRVGLTKCSVGTRIDRALKALRKELGENFKN